MTDADYRHAQRLLELVLRAVPRAAECPMSRERMLRLAREVHLLRARLGQPAPHSQRN